MVAWLSSIEKKHLNYCGKFVLTGDMSELTITKVDLSNMNTLEGNVRWCPRASPKLCTRVMAMCLYLPPPTHPLIPGDIAVLASLTQIVELNLWNCRNLQGRSVDGGRG